MHLSNFKPSLHQICYNPNHEETGKGLERRNRAQAFRRVGARSPERDLHLRPRALPLAPQDLLPRGGLHSRGARGIRTSVCTGRLPDWLAALPKPAAVMAALDERAIEILSACGEARIQVPRQVAVIGVDNDELLCDFSDPPLSSVLPDHVREGALAAAELNRMLRSRKPRNG